MLAPSTPCLERFSFAASTSLHDYTCLGNHRCPDLIVPDIYSAIISIILSGSCVLLHFGGHACNEEMNKCCEHLMLWGIYLKIRIPDLSFHSCNAGCYGLPYHPLTPQLCSCNLPGSSLAHDVYNVDWSVDVLSQVQGSGCSLVLRNLSRQHTGRDLGQDFYTLSDQPCECNKQHGTCSCYDAMWP